MRHAPALCLLVVAACNASLRSETGDAAVTLDVEPEVVAAGDSVALVLRNGAAERIGYNLCSSALERRVGGVWQAVLEDRMCTMELRTLDPAAEARYTLSIASNAAPGEYRYVTTVERLGEGTRGPVRSEPFRVSS